MVSYLPMHRFNLGISGTGFFQLAASAGIIGGFIVVWKVTALKRVSALIVGFAATLGFLEAMSPSIPQSILGFCLMNLLFECIWLRASTDFFVKCPREKIGQFQFTMQTFAAVLMAGATFLYAIILENGGSDLLVTIVRSSLVIQIFCILAVKLWTSRVDRRTR